MPLDQMHSANPPSHPELLAWLARDTATHGYDLRRLIRGLVLSEAYARSSRWDGEEAPRPSLFAVAARASPDADATGELAPAGDRRPGKSAAGLPIRAVRETDRGPGGERRSLATSFTTSSGDSQIGVAEALLFSNGKRITSELLADGPDRLVGRLKQTAGQAELIDLAVRNVLSRPPDDDEVRRLGRSTSGNAPTGPRMRAEQLVWVLLTCSEFRFNH